MRKFGIREDVKGALEMACSGTVAGAGVGAVTATKSWLRREHLGVADGGGGGRGSEKRQVIWRENGWAEDIFDGWLMCSHPSPLCSKSAQAKVALDGLS